MAGVKAILAKSVARIFFRNAINLDCRFYYAIPMISMTAMSWKSSWRKVL